MQFEPVPHKWKGGEDGTYLWHTGCETVAIRNDVVGPNAAWLHDAVTECRRIPETETSLFPDFVTLAG